MCSITHLVSLTHINGQFTVAQKIFGVRDYPLLGAIHADFLTAIYYDSNGHQLVGVGNGD